MSTKLVNKCCNFDEFRLLIRCHFYLWVTHTEYSVVTISRCKDKYLVRMNRQHSFAVDFLNLISSYKLMHAGLLPLVLAVPQNSVQWTEQGTDVTLLSLNPVMHLHNQLSKLSLEHITLLYVKDEIRYCTDQHDNEKVLFAVNTGDQVFKQINRSKNIFF